MLKIDCFEKPLNKLILLVFLFQKIMRRSFGLFLVGWLSCSALLAQTWTRVQSWGLDLETIHWIDEDLGFAAGENLIIKSTDGGVSWEEIPYSFEGKLLSISFWDEDNGVAVGEAGLILQTKDGGNTWTTRNPGLPTDLNSVTVKSETSAIAVGANGQVIQTSNQGDTWTNVSFGQTVSLNEITFANADTAYIVGNNGRVFRSTNSGSSWTSLTSGVTTNLRGIAFSSPSIGYAVGEVGVVIKTTDAGESWQSLSSGVTVDLNKVAISELDSRIVTVVGNEATALRSINSGGSFGKANLGAGNLRNLKNLDFISGTNQVFAVGQDGYLISSTNAGSSYSQRLAGVRSDFTATDFKTDRVGLIGAKNGGFYATGNAGASLASRPLPEEVDLLKINFWNANIGFVGSENGKIFRTGNGGASWVSVPAGTSETITGFHLFAPSAIYISGTNGYIARSFDSGGTWDSGLNVNTNENLNDLRFFDNQFGFAIGENGQLSWTDGGTDWENLPKLTNENLNSIAIINSSTAIVVGNNGVILKTEDKARTWRIIETEFTEDFISADFFGISLGFIVGENGFSLQSSDAGETWTKIPSGTTRNLTSVSVSSSLVAFAVGDDGTLLNYTCIPPTAGVGEITGKAETCLSSETYSIPEGATPGGNLAWRVDGGEIISGQGTSEVEVFWTNPGRNGLFVSIENFCGSGETSFLEIETTGLPNSSIQIQGQGAVCEGNEENYSLPEQDGSIYTWEVSGGSLLEGQGTSAIRVAWEESGSHTIQATIENSCGTSAPIVLPITVNQAPEQPTEIQGESQVGLWESTYETEDQEDVNFIWEILPEGGRILEGQGSNKITVAWEVEGEYELKVTPENQCEEGSSRFLAVRVDVVTSLPEEENFEFRVYPNPSSGTIHIKLDGSVDWKSLSIINAYGQEIRSQKLTSGVKELTINDLPTGLMIIQLQTGTQIVNRKIVVN